MLETLRELQFIIERESGGKSDIRLIFWFIVKSDPEIKIRLKRVKREISSNSLRTLRLRSRCTIFIFAGRGNVG
jgi:hypothetical protein